MTGWRWWRLYLRLLLRGDRQHFLNSMSAIDHWAPHSSPGRDRAIRFARWLAPRRGWT